MCSCHISEPLSILCIKSEILSIKLEAYCSPYFHIVLHWSRTGDKILHQPIWNTQLYNVSDFVSLLSHS